MARFRQTAKYAGKGQKALPDRIEKLLAQGFTFEPPITRVGLAQAPQCNYDSRPQITCPDGHVVNAERAIGLRRAVDKAEHHLSARAEEQRIISERNNDDK